MGHSPGVADVFRAHGAAWRKANAGHVSLGQLKVMSAIETCGTAALGGHVERGETARTNASPTIPAATATARSARGRRRGNGSKTAKPNSCRSPIFRSTAPSSFYTGGRTTGPETQVIRPSSLMTEAVALTPRAPDEQASGGGFSAGNWLAS
jgi:hypothetical protein